MSPPSAQQTGRISGRDRQFLPAALEILETPAPPASVALMLTICAFAASGILWSFLGHLDVNAVAPGKIETLGYAKEIEALDSGKLSAIYIEPGATVHAGDLLIEFDTAEAEADHKAALNDLMTAQAEVARRNFAVDAITQKVAAKLQNASASDADEQPTPETNLGAGLALVAAQTSSSIPWDGSIPSDIRQREQSVLKADLLQLSATINSLERQSDSKRATIKRLGESIILDQSVIATVTELQAMRQYTFEKEIGSKTNLLDAEVELEKAQGQLTADKGQLSETEASLQENISEETRTIQQFVADNENKIDDASKRADDAKQAVNKAEARLNHAKLFAPVDGIVQALAATTVGQVFTTGQQIMVIAPAKPTLQIQALVPNTDIGFLKLGQPAVIKVDAFPFTRYGTIPGHIVWIAPEAVEEQDAKRQMASALASVNEGSSASGGTPGQAPSFVFPVTIALDKTSIAIDGADVRLSSGMTVVAEIRTGQRRIIDYLLSPIAKTANEAFKER